VLLLGLALQLAGPLGLGRLPVVAALVAPRNAVTAGFAVLALLLLLLCLRRGMRRLALPAGVALVLVAVAGLQIGAGRGTRVETAAPPAPGTIRILSWNTNGDLVTARTVARLAAREHADVVVLPEIAPEENGPDWIPAFAAVGLPVTAVPPIDSGTVATEALVSDRLPPYRGGGGWPDERATSAIVRPTDPRLPVIVALHAAQPSLSGNGLWNAELDRIAAACVSPDVVVIGDLNGTLDDFGGPSIGGCRDAAALRGAAALGTWPTAVAPLLAMPIDHVLVGSRWRVRSFSVLTSEDDSGARHRPILAVLARS
jgi:endonuclease/exonuclease/phosphatase (EEP) superfamily protein YafD